MVKVDLSDGMKWIVDRLPNDVYHDFTNELYYAMLPVLKRYGYDKEMATAFNETRAVNFERT